MSGPRVLVTGASGPAGRALLVQLDERGIPAIGADLVADGRDPRVLQVPAADDPNLLGELRRIVADHRIDVVIPTVSEELPRLSRAAASLGPDVAVIVGAPGPVDACHDKLATARTLSARGVPVPAFALASEVGGMAEAFDRLGFPFVAKPRVSRGGRGVVVVRSEADLDWASLDDRWILQEFAPGTEYAPVVYRSGSPGAPSTVAVLEKTALKGGEIGNAVAVRRRMGAAVSDVRQLAVQAIAALGLTGPADIDVRRRRDGAPVVLEVNARFGANSRSAPELLDRVLTEHAALSRVA
ncbi:ATP-grasp domain-containing protein [Naasia sp. SYSU D00057]|uniref:ATP-grasp domain-containing protein n=1 Tax=Naasia sp. SYSU D00057 TaxID=2817380 RepID=UPI001B305E5D|nr:ATP-grasp domain-containing protein [Naasia sp. SYSU D00057]